MPMTPLSLLSPLAGKPKIPLRDPGLVCVQIETIPPLQRKLLFIPVDWKRKLILSLKVLA